MISQTSAHELKIGKGKPEFKLDWQNFDATAFEASRIQFQNAGKQIGIAAQKLSECLAKSLVIMHTQLKPLQDRAAKHEAEVRRIKSVKSRQIITRKTRRRMRFN